ncbi:MAG: rhomboid family intramembrane serine protease [Acidobacteria bacterium]|nr:rhomboid family intramembrane serine protease [Acidobacteriota bacterium]
MAYDASRIRAADREERLEQGSPLDRFVERVATLCNQFGLNGTRLLWRWRNWRSTQAEARAQRVNRLRAATGKFKMCPSCRSLVPAGQGTCSSCGVSLASVRAPGAARYIANAMPLSRSVTAMVVTANVAVYVLMGLAAGFAQPKGGGMSGLFSLLGFDSFTLARFGWGYGPWVIYAGEYWRLFTPLFIHAGLIHLFFNCYVLMQVGRLIEEEFGGTRTWVIYLLSGVSGGLASNFVRPLLGMGHVPYVGASGAVFGLIGLAMITGWRRGGPAGHAIKRSMITWTIYVLLFGFVMGADNFAHIGGLAGGVVAGLVVDGRATNPRAAALWKAAAWAGVAICFWAFFMAAVHGPEAIPRMQ